MSEKNMLRFISEIGVNHLGSEETALRYCKVLSKTQTDAISFQIRERDFYDGSALWKNELSEQCYSQCLEVVRGSGKSFGFAVGDLDTAKQYHSLRPDFWKVLSWGLKDITLIKFLVESDKPVFVSTGMSGIEEIVSVAKKFGTKISFIHTQLSVDNEDVNLSAISSMRQATGCHVSFGLHCDNFAVMGLSLAFKPEALFFYVKERVDFDYPDNSYAILLSKLDLMIGQTNLLAKSLGNGIKTSFTPKTLSVEEQKKLANIKSGDT